VAVGGRGESDTPRFDHMGFPGGNADSQGPAGGSDRSVRGYWETESPAAADGGARSASQSRFLPDDRTGFPGALGAWGVSLEPVRSRVPPSFGQARGVASGRFAYVSGTGLCVGRLGEVQH
jgi:hypothetical protein